MKLSEIQDILYQIEKKHERYGLLFHVTADVNLPKIKELGLLPLLEIRKKNVSIQPFIGNDGYLCSVERMTSVHLFTAPNICVAFLQLFKKINQKLNLDVWSATPIQIISVILPFTSDIDIDTDVGFSEGFPNAVRFPGIISKDSIFEITTLSDFITRFNLVDQLNQEIPEISITQL